MHALLLVSRDDGGTLDMALDTGAAALVLDLTADPAAGMARAREQVCAFLEGLRRGCKRSPPCFVRIDASGSQRSEDDLAAVMPWRPDGIVLGGIDGGRDVQDLSSRLAVHEAQQGFADGATRIIAVAGETAASVFALGSLRGCSSRLVGVGWSTEALRLALAAEHTETDKGVLTVPYATTRALVLVAAGAAGVPAYDLTLEPLDRAKSIQLCNEARRDGFTWKLAINAEQVASIQGEIIA